MRHLFTDLQCERSKSRWREPGVIPVIHKLLFQCTPRVNVATAYWSSSLSNMETLDDKKMRGPNLELAAAYIIQTLQQNCMILIGSRLQPPSLCAHVSEAGRAPAGTTPCRRLPCFHLLPALPREGRGPGQVAVSSTCPCFPRACVWVSCLLLCAQCRPSSSIVTLARGELSGWQHLFCFGFVS